MTIAVAMIVVVVPVRYYCCQPVANDIQSLSLPLILLLLFFFFAIHSAIPFSELFITTIAAAGYKNLLGLNNTLCATAFFLRNARGVLLHHFTFHMRDNWKPILKCMSLNTGR